MRKYFLVLVSLGSCSLAQVALCAEQAGNAVPQVPSVVAGATSAASSIAGSFVEATIEVRKNAPDPSSDLSPFKYRGELALTSSDPKFKGFTGLWISPDGTKLAAVEGGKWLEATLAYDGAGDLSALKISRSGLLLGTNGDPLANEADKDAEALAFDGRRFIVGFEGNHRLVAYNNFDSPAIDLKLPPEAVAGIPPTAGFASVAASRGRVLTLAEYTPEDVHSTEYQINKTRGWLITNQGAGFIWLRASAQAAPMDLATFPNGDLLLLEALRPPQGQIAETRVSRISSEKISIGATLEAEEIKVLGPPLKGAFFKAASIRRGKSGELLIYLVSSTAPSNLYMFELSTSRK